MTKFKEIFNNRTMIDGGQLYPTRTLNTRFQVVIFFLQPSCCLDDSIRDESHLGKKMTVGMLLVQVGHFPNLWKWTFEPWMFHLWKKFWTIVSQSLIFKISHNSYMIPTVHNQQFLPKYLMFSTKDIQLFHFKKIHSDI